MDKDILTKVEQLIAEAVRKADPKHPEYEEAWVDRANKLMAWKCRLLGVEEIPNRS